MSYALFLGFTSIPLSKHDNFQHHIRTLFKSVLPNPPETSPLYKPEFFLLFGDYDLLTLAFVDDAEFALRSFTPYNPRFGSNNNAPFDHQVLLSLGVHEDSGIENHILEESLKSTPLISVVRIKLSTYLLSAYGLAFRNAILERIKNELAKCNIDKWILTETFSWNEITLVVFSTQYQGVFELLTELRGIRVDEICGNFNDDRYKTVDIVKINHPVIKNTHTTFGFYQKYSNPEKVVLSPVTSILTKGDSFKNILDDFGTEYKDISKKFDIRLGIGNTDIVLLPKKDEIPTLLDIKLIFELATKKRSNEILNIRSLILSDIPKAPKSEQEFLRDFQKKLLVTEEDIKEVVRTLKAEGFSKIERDAVLNLLSEFNCAVQDSYLYGYFLDLHPFVVGLVNKLKNNKTPQNFYKDIEQRHIHLQQVIESFSIAYNNRFLQSFVMNDITDNNMFFKGGVQNLIGTYSVVQSVMNALTGLQPKFIYVHGNSDIVSTKSGIGLNFIHLIQPLLVIQHIIYENLIQKVTLVLESEEFRHKVAEYKGKEKIIGLSTLKIASSIKETISIRIDEAFKPVLGNGEDMNEFTEAMSDNIASGYLDFIREDPDSLSHFVTDYIVYHFLFNKDIELMEYIYWGIFASNPSTTARLNSYHRDHFFKYYLRLHLLEKSMDEVPEKNIAMDFMPSDNWRNLLGIIDLAKGSKILDDYFASDEFMILKNIAKDVYERIILHTRIFQSDTFETGFLSRDKVDSMDKIRNLNDSNYPILAIQHYVSLIITYYNDFAEKLFKKYYVPGKSAVLSRIDTTYPQGKETNALGEPFAIDGDNLFLFDLLGGYYIQDQSVREEYMMMRKELLEQLAELSHERKFGYLKGVHRSKQVNWELLGKLI